FVLDGDDRGLQGDNGFAASDVALEKTIHRKWLFHVCDNFGENFLLGVGGLEWEDALQRVADIFFADLKGDRFFLADGAGFQGETKLEEEKFLEDEAALRGAAIFVERGDGFVGRREMCLGDGDGAWWKLQASAQLFRKDFGHAAWIDELEGGVNRAA